MNELYTRHVGGWRIVHFPGSKSVLGAWYVYRSDTRIHEYVCRSEDEAVRWAEQRKGLIDAVD